MPILALILLAAILVVATIVVSLATAYDIHRQKARLSALDQQLQAIEAEADKAFEQRHAADDTLDLHWNLREEKVAAIQETVEQLERLESGAGEDDREIGISPGLRQRTGEDAAGD